MNSCSLVIVIAVVAGVSGKRPAMALGIAGLVLVGLVLLTVLMYFGRHVTAAPEPPRAVMWSQPNGPMSVSWQDDAFHGMTPNEVHTQWRISFFPLLLLAGAVAAIVLFGLFRRSGGAACAAPHHRAWWPAALLLLLLPLGFFFVARTDVQQSASISNHFDAEMHARQIHERVARQQAELERRQAELAQRTGELNSELQHRIENMEIHKLMDLVDAPRIMLPIPTPATIAQWAVAIAAEEESADAESPAETTEKHAEDDASVQAEADAAVSVIAAESDAEVHQASASTADGHAVSATSPAASATASSDTDEAERPTATSSVAPARPGSRAASSEPRPSWALQTPKRVGNVRRDVVTTDEYATTDECYWAADRLLQLKTYEHLQRLVGTPYGSDRMLQLRAEALNIEGHTPWFLIGIDEGGHHGRLHPPRDCPRRIFGGIAAFVRANAETLHPDRILSVGRQRTAPTLGRQPAAGAICVCRLGCKRRSGLVGTGLGTLEGRYLDQGLLYEAAIHRRAAGDTGDIRPLCVASRNGFRPAALNLDYRVSRRGAGNAEGENTNLRLFSLILISGY